MKELFARAGLALAAALFLSALVSCGDGAAALEADRLNDAAYRYHYVCLDSVYSLARGAQALSRHYEAGRMEALNHLAFAEMAEMNYDAARGHLLRVLDKTGNQIELMVANVQMMRLCQRMSRNKEFYAYYWAAGQNEERIGESLGELSPRQLRRYAYARSEMRIVYAAYLYYTGQMETFRSVLSRAAPEETPAAADTAQVLNYLYNTGSGGYYTGGSAEDRASREFTDLIKCCLIAVRSGQVYWQANALQAMSEHLLPEGAARRLTGENPLYMRALNADNVPDTLLAASFARRAVDLFSSYGDAYQRAAALRTLSDCHFAAGRPDSAALRLNEALEDNSAKRSPALASSIYERLSITFSALGDKPLSDHYRNLYLDTQENTRQDRELDLRAEQLSRASRQINFILLLLMAIVVFLFCTLYTLVKKRVSRDTSGTVEKLFAPLERWKELQMLDAEERAARSEETEERRRMAELTLERNLGINVGQRAKVSVVSSVAPLINRITAETARLAGGGESSEKRAARKAYISELAAKIEEYNDVLTRWIQTRKGEVAMRIESFPLQDVFDVIAKGRSSFALEGKTLEVRPTAAVVKADKALTLFMINTMADNARKAVDTDGRVEVFAEEKETCVEIGIRDNGRGMDSAELEKILDRRAALPAAESQAGSAGHGFGLMNCKGIMEKYKKTGALFSVCGMSASSSPGKGTVFRFRLPRGAARLAVLAVCLCLSECPAAGAGALERAKIFADSTYFCNLQGRYSDALGFAGKALGELNAYYLSVRPGGADTLGLSEGEGIPELRWFADSVKADYDVILDVRNEAAVAALALHRWDTYSYNNRIYTRLFQETSKDASLPGYVGGMRRAAEAKNAAVVLLVLLVLALVVLYYFLYYRPKVIMRQVAERANMINGALFEDTGEEEKKEKILGLWRGAGHLRALTAGERRAVESLDGVVGRILGALEKNRGAREKNEDELEMAEDEVRRINFESGNLHVDNNVLDNCLSALKHETMYYPTKIRQLAASADDNAAQLDEVGQYYRALFSILSLQAQSRVSRPLPADERLKSFLKGLLANLFPAPGAVVERLDAGPGYEAFAFTYAGAGLAPGAAAELFTPLTANLKCLLLRQAVREIGESTARRGCGVSASELRGGGVRIVLRLGAGTGFGKTLGL